MPRGSVSNLLRVTQAAFELYAQNVKVEPPLDLPLICLPSVRAEKDFLFHAFVYYEAHTISGLQTTKWAVFCCLARTGVYICLLIVLPDPEGQGLEAL